MLEFFNPPAARERLAADKIDAEYRRMRLKVFLVRSLAMRPIIWCVRICRLRLRV